MENLEAEAGECKPIHKLIVYETFRVDEVISCSYNINVDPASEFVAGGDCGSYPAGMDSELTIKVTPEKDETCPVKELHFSGFSAVRKHDLIRAAIPRCDLLEEENYTHSFDRPYKEKESAIEIAILESTVSTARIDRSVDYDRFQKP